MTKRLFGICLALTATACAFAQSQSPSQPPATTPEPAEATPEPAAAEPAPAAAAADDHSSAGLLGKDYFAFEPIMQDFRNSTSKKGWGTTLDLNLPASDNFDIGLNYDFERVADIPRITDNTFGTSVTGYFKAGGVKPFADVDLGYLWHRIKPSDPTQRYDRATYAVGTGLEAPILGSTAVVGRVAYNDEFRRGAIHEMTYTAGLDQRFSDHVAGLVGVTFQQNNAILYNLGVGFIF